MAGLKLQAVTKSWDGKTQVIKPLTLDVADGEFIMMVRPSGCRKSTLLHMVARLEQVTEGNIWINNQHMTEMEPKDHRIAMVFQNYTLYPHMSVKENMAWGLKIHSMGKQQIAKHVKEAAHILELDSLLKHRPRKLSSSQHQHVAMGHAIVHDPAVFLFDEPLSNLNAKLHMQMHLELQQLHHHLKTTSLYITHNQVEAMTLTQQVMVMNSSVAKQIGTPVEVYKKPTSLFVASFISSPAMNLLTGHMNNKGTHFKLDSSIELPLNSGYHQYARHKMTLSIHPEHIALSSQAEGSIPMVMDTLEILSADNLAHRHWGKQKLVVQLAHQEHPTAGSTLWLHLAENQLHLFDGETGQQV